MSVKKAVTTCPLAAALALTASICKRLSTTSVRTTLYRLAPIGGVGSTMLMTTCEPMVTVGGAALLLRPVTRGVWTVVVPVIGP